MNDITTCYERIGQPEWDNNDYQRDFIWLGIRRDLLKVPKYTVTEDTLKSLDNSYTYHSPKDDQPTRYVLIRDAAKAFAILCCENAPKSRELSIALTDLEKVVTMVNKAIACNE